MQPPPARGGQAGALVDAAASPGRDPRPTRRPVAGVLEQALATQEQEGGRIGEVLVKMRACSEEAVLRALGEQLGIGYSPELRFEDVDGDLATRIPIGFSKQHKALPVKRDGDAVVVATADPLDLGALDDIRAQLGSEVYPVLVPSQKILDAINHVHGAKHDKGGELGDSEDEEEMGAAEELVDILDVNDEAPIIRWVNSLLFNAVKERASDIHIEPGEKEVSVRYRIDGVLYEKRHAARQFLPSIIARVKIMAGLNIAEKRLPQDGRIRRKIAGKDIDMRVATAPTVKGGERITIRLLDRENVLHDLADIGFGDDHLRAMDDLIHRPHGILLVTGPTGSGKTTTLYACLSKINSPDLNILTIEDPGRVPARWHLAGGGQRQDRSDLRHRAALVPAPRSRRHHGGRDPRSAHGRDRHPGLADRPPGAVHHPHQRRRGGHHPAGRAGGAAVPGGHLAGGPAGPAAGAPAVPGLQGAVPPGRRGDRQPGVAAGAVPHGQGQAGGVQEREAAPSRAWCIRAREGGCASCLGAGYRGRTAIYELLLIDDTIRQLANKNTDGPTLKKAAMAKGMRTLRDDGAQKVLAGMTSAAEVLMLTAEDVD